MSPPARTDVHELETATEALVTVLDRLQPTEDNHPDADLLVQALPCCVEVAGLLAALAGCLGALATSLSDMSDGAPAQRAADEMMADIAADLNTMRSLLHRATLVAAPTLADLRRLPTASVRRAAERSTVENGLPSMATRSRP